MKTQTKQEPHVVISASPLRFPWQTLDPFLFCVHHDDAYPAANAQLGPAAPLTGRSLGEDFAGKDGWNMYHGTVVPGFPQHPHRGFETVTVVRQGLIDHSDSFGATARYGGGDVQWLTAGKGINHSEMFPLLKQDSDNPLELFQIWLNLPRADKFAEPHFAMLWNESVPRRTLTDAKGRTTEVTVIAGRFGDASPQPPPPSSWAARPDSDVGIWTLKLTPGASFTLPPGTAGSNRMLYLFRGDGLKVGGRLIGSKTAVELRAERMVTLETDSTGAELLLLQGRPINEPVVQYGPFVMNSRQEIQQAFADYQRTGFGGWKWPSNAPVHAIDEGRFALRPDGKLERPT
ncbi:MAG: pirin family protein [Myxococcota bacterium]|nr:pirin family protein [Myxococcota bacterium]